MNKQDIINNLEEVKRWVTEIDQDSDQKQEEREVFIEIKNRWTGSVIFRSKKTTFRDAVLDAIASKANLTDADLTSANLTDANLTDADLTRADLTGCLYYMGNGNRNFEALCKAIHTIKHRDGSFDELTK